MKTPFLLAPMAELSHRALRELIEGFGGCDGYYTEMISAAALLAGGPFEKWYIDNGPCPEKLVFQLIGADSGQISRAAAILDRLECVGIDLNMGCCAPLIRKTGAGIAWMSSPSQEGAVDRAGELVKQVRKTVKRRLSAKIRLGLTDDFEYLVRFCRRLEAEGLEFIVLHPRTAREKLKRRARWDYVGALRQELRIPVAGNGDISSAEELLSRAESPCDGVMVGRAAVCQPWIFAEAKKMVTVTVPTIPETQSQKCMPRDGNGGWRRQECRASTVLWPRQQVGDDGTPDKFLEHTFLEETGLRFLELLARWQPPEFHISRARRFFGFFCDNLKWGTYLKNLLNREETLSGMERVWRNFFTDPQRSQS